ncbi:mate-domain-containing protein [Haematococcus lacustris]
MLSTGCTTRLHLGRPRQRLTFAACALLRWNPAAFKAGTPLRLSSPNEQPTLRACVRAPAASVAAGLSTSGPAPIGSRPALSPAFDKEIAAIALPALCSMLLEPFMGVINSGMIGRLGTQQLGAVSVASLVVSFATFLFSFLLFLTTPEIAAAVSKGNKAEVSRISARGFWLAGAMGALVTALLVLGGPHIISLMAPPEPAVAAYATQYIGVRAWGLMGALLGFVATGTYRGFKDTRTPLYVAMGSAVLSLALNYTFICVFEWGVAGAALAITLAQASSAAALCSLLVVKGMLQLKDLVTPPSWGSVGPLLRRGAVLGLRNAINMGMVLYASMLCVRAGSVYQASFEVVRQVWIVAIQCFECLNVTAQTLCATYLGSGDRVTAEAMLQRLLFLGMLVGSVVGVVVFLAQHPVTRFFTSDAAVIAQVLTTLPLVALLFPLDAAASIMDGSLLAAKQTDYMSAVQIAGSALQYGCLVWLSSNNLISSMSIWAVLKVLTIVRVGGGVYRTWMSPASAYLPLPEAKTVAAKHFLAHSARAEPAVAAVEAASISAAPAGTNRIAATSRLLSDAGLQEGIQLDSAPTSSSQQLPTLPEPSTSHVAYILHGSGSSTEAWQRLEREALVAATATAAACACAGSVTDVGAGVDIIGEVADSMDEELQGAGQSHDEQGELSLPRHLGERSDTGDVDMAASGAAQQGIPLSLIAGGPGADTPVSARSLP